MYNSVHLCICIGSECVCVYMCILIVCVFLCRPTLGSGPKCRRGLQNHEDRQEEPKPVRYETEPAVEPQVTTNPRPAGMI